MKIDTFRYTALLFWTLKETKLKGFPSYRFKIWNFTQESFLNILIWKSLKLEVSKYFTLQFFLVISLTVVLIRHNVNLTINLNLDPSQDYF